jgi:hypothetical protein
MSKLLGKRRKGSSSPITDVHEKPLVGRMPNAINGIRVTREPAMNLAIVAPDPAAQVPHKVEASASLAH